MHPFEKRLEGILSPATCASGTVGTTSALLIADSTYDGIEMRRRVRVMNTHATQYLGVATIARGATATAETLAASYNVAPAGGVLDIVIGPLVRLAVVGGGAGTTYNVCVSDV
jgi:hypothetical protein